MQDYEKVTASQDQNTFESIASLNPHSMSRNVSGKSSTCHGDVTGLSTTSREVDVIECGL